MASFALISEGVTDHLVIKRILISFFRDEEPSVNYVHPEYDETSRHAEKDHGGWGLVLKALEKGDHRRAFENNDYLIVHLDTDVSEQKGYDVPHREGGHELSAEELASRVGDKLRGLMGKEFLEQYGARVLLAIAVHSTECWLLPLFHDDAHARKITGCLAAMNKALKRANMAPLSKADGSDKDPRAYKEAARGFRKRFLEVHDKNPSLKLFVDQLSARCGQAMPAPEAT